MKFTFSGGNFEMRMSGKFQMRVYGNFSARMSGKFYANTQFRRKRFLVMFPDMGSL